MHRTHRHYQKGLSHHLLLPIIAFVMVGAIGAYILAHSSAATVGYNVWQWNIAGHEMNKDSVTNGTTEVAVASILNRKAQLVSFNEMCKGQYNDVERRLKKAGWNEAGNFSAFVTTKTSNCGTQSYGNAIFIKAGMKDVAKYSLQDDGSNERRAMVCALVAGTKDRFCSVHITTSGEKINGKPINEQQLDRVRSILESYYRKGERVIIAGDFNSQPNYGRMNSWYAASLKTPNNPNNNGVYREVDDNDAAHCIGYGEYTAGGNSDTTPCGTSHKKIDMIFFRENQVTSYWGDSLSISHKCGSNKKTACSDHRILIGNIVFKD